MSYIKNCKVCGEKISLREMSHGQWVAFDANTDKPHKHSKRSRQKPGSKNPPIDTDLNQSTSTEQTSNTPKIVFAVIVVLLIIYLFN